MAITKPPSTNRNNLEIPTAPSGSCPMIFSLTNFGTALKIMPTNIKTNQMIINARLVSILPLYPKIILFFSDFTHLNTNNYKLKP